MEIVISIHLLSVLALAIFGTLALTAEGPKKNFILTTRIIYLPLFVSGIIAAFRSAQNQPILTVAKIAAALILIALLEIIFSKKERQGSNLMLILVLLVFTLTSVLGIALVLNR
ncbi:DUF1516 family protein [Oenococcus alcoholitolerans]|uniref:DUF1516 family protein n=1 Tax=Oenococcus alcoholitolerans TaxID=931074 RepID=UPI003F7176AF